MKIFLAIFLIFIFLFCIVHSEYIPPIKEDILLNTDKLNYQDYDSSVSYLDLVSEINKKLTYDLSPNLSIQMFLIKPGGKLSPDAILPVPEVLYLFYGQANITAGEDIIHADKEEAVYIPANVTRMIENTGDDTLSLLSYIDWNETLSQPDSINIKNISNISNEVNIPLVINESEITPLWFGNNSSGDEYAFYRLLHPSERPLALSYDLGSVIIPSGGDIPDHYFEGSSQLLFFLSGTGNVSVSCTKHPVKIDQILFVAPGAVINISATEDMHIMMITSPYYLAKNDYIFPDACIDN